MKELKELLIGVYAIIGVLFGLYGTFFGNMAHKGFAYNMGKAIVWPTMLFPSLSQLLGGIILIGFIFWAVYMTD